MRVLITLCMTLLFIGIAGVCPKDATAQAQSVVISSENRPLESLRRAAREKRDEGVQEVPGIIIIPNRAGKEDTRSQQSDFDGSGTTFQSTPGPLATSILNVFDGADNDDNAAVIGGQVSPPDTDGDVGPNHYVQMINLVTTIFDKNGNILPGGGPFPGNAFWSGQGGSCEAFNNGDPIVLYDEVNDRWLVSQFAFDSNLSAGSLAMCIAVSQTGDPLGAYNRYEYSFTSVGLPDYPKLGLVTESITFMANIFTPPFFPFGGTFVGAIDKNAMYAGTTAQFIGFNLGTSEFGFVAGDLDDASGTAGVVPALFATAMSRSNLFDIWEVEPDFANGGANPTATRIAAIPIAGFDTDFCTANREACIPQPSPGVDLETLSGRLMHRLQIRDFGSYRTMMASHAVDVGGGRAGVRWYEMRESSGTWSLHQEGTYAPADGENRWMPSIAMNAAGDIGLGYLVSSNSTFMSVAVTGQTAANSGTGLMDGTEVTCAAGTGAQTGSARAGDYAATSVDPVTDSFWHTNEYMGPTGSVPWNTTVCEFSVTSAPANQPPVVTITSPADGSSFNDGDTINFTGTATDNEDGTISGSITWSSDLDGSLGSGASVSTTLSIGTHIITASVTDSGGLSDSDQITVTVNFVAGGDPALETVTVSGVSSASWTTVNLANSYTSMVAVCTPEYANNAVPMVVRMRNASGNSFEIQLQNPSGASLSAEDVNCVAVEEGSWAFPDGRLLEAQRYTSTVTDENNSWVGEAQTYQNTYTNPVVLGQVMTFNDSDWSVFWDQGTSRTNPPSASTLVTGKTVAEDTDVTRANEDVGFIVFEAGTGSVNGVLYEAALGADIVAGVTNAPPYTYSFTQSFGSAPQVAIATMAAVDGNNGGWSYLFGGTPTSSTGLDLVIDEDQIGDSERAHTTEQVAYLVFESNVNVTFGGDPPVTSSLETAIVSGVSSSSWTAVTLDNTYTSMVAVCSIVYQNNTIPEVVRMRNASGNSFEIMLQNPSGTALSGESVYCLVAEEGAWQLPDGRLIEAATYNSTVTDHDGSWVGELQSYAQSYTNPVVVGQVMTNNDADWSAFWTRGSSRSNPPTASAFYAGKHVAEDTDITRADETVGYIVFEEGSGTVGTTPYEAVLGTDIVLGVGNGGTYSYTFAQAFSSTPAAAVVTMAAMDGVNGGWAYLDGSGALSAANIDVVIDEDQINDTERNHTSEQVAYIVFGDDVDVTLSGPSLLSGRLNAANVQEDIEKSIAGSYLPEEFALTDVYPNPFNDQLTIRYGVPEASYVRIEIYNLLGQLVDTVVDGSKDKGYHQLQWSGARSDGGDLVSGMYIIRLQSEESIKTRKVMYLK
ncbi:MAG: T9SS type A sorting domain-containing protein [Rhodothermaceae bacterium]|nr:T9SS type A sorting domain-containing protein [Rhodothermaceae bacterium]